jgi:hypothetical protein
MMAGFIDAIVAFLKAVNAVLSVVPGLMWGVAVLVLFLWGGAMHHERNEARGERDVAVAQLDSLIKKVVAQKLEARLLFEKLTAEVKQLQARLNDAQKAQEKKDANNKATIDAQARRLADAAAAHGGQLRDPNGCGRGGASPEGQGGAAAGTGEEHRAEAGGLLSAQLSRLLGKLTREADDINAAYESCRADAVNVRQALEPVP